MIKLAVRLLHIVICCGLVGCGGQEGARENDLSVAGPDLALPCVVGDGGAPPVFENMQALFDDHCTICHSGSAAVVLLRGMAYAQLVNRPTQTMEMIDESCGGILVVPGRPEQSYIYHKLTEAMPCAGAQMPKGELGSEPLAACQIDLVRRWILAGAPP